MGKGGKISIIRKQLELSPHTCHEIGRTQDAIMKYIYTEKSFNRKLGTTTGRNVLIESESTEEVLIKKWIENHLGFRMTMMLVNKHIEE